MDTSRFLACALALAANAGCGSNEGDAATNAPAKVEQVKPARGSDWTEVVHATAAGGFVMGNPGAKVKLVEFGSMTCPHCKAFDDEGVPHLLAYVKTGEVSWEFRNYVRDAFDVTASLVARCDGARSFFPLTRVLFADQPKWIARVAAAPQNQLKSAQDLPPSKQFVALANVAGFQQLAAGHGLAPARSNQCLANENSVKQLVQMAEDATRKFPDFEGTPTFVINGTMLEDTATWDNLEPQLKAALGRHG